MKKSTLAIAVALAVCSVPSWAGWSSGTFGGLSSLIYTPSKPASGRMLFINLHGCGQKNTDIQKSNWDGVAEKYNAVIVLPNVKNSTMVGCWNYGNPSVNTSDYNALVNGTKTIVADSKYGIDRNQVYVTGISSGATFAATVGCGNPDLFAGVGSAAGPTINSSQMSAMGGGSPNVDSVVSYCKNLAKGKEAHYATQLYAQTYGAELPGSDSLCGPTWIEPNHKIFQKLVGVIGGATHEQDIPASNPTAGHTNTNENEHYVTDGYQAKRVSLIEIPGLGHAWPGGVPKSGTVGSYVSDKFDFGAWMAENFTANNCRIEANKSKSQCGNASTTTSSTTTTTPGASTTTSTSVISTTTTTINNGTTLTPGSGTWVKETTTYGVNGVSLQNAYVYVPKNTSPEVREGKRALMLTLHGCSQTAQGNVIDKKFNWEDTAEKYGMVVVAPTVPTSSRKVAGCWDWFDSNHTRTARDEAPLLQLIDNLKNRAGLDIDARQVYVSGLSSGGGMANNLGCVAPDVFAGVGSNAGPANDTPYALPNSKPTQTAQQVANNCRTTAGGYAASLDTQIVSVVNGTMDALVHPDHDQLVEDASKILFGANAAGAALPTEKKCAGRQWNDAKGPRVARHQCDGMSHAWPAGEGGSGGGSYVNYTYMNYPAWLTSWLFQNNRRLDGVHPTTTTSTLIGTTTTTIGSTTTTTIPQQCWTTSATDTATYHYLAKRLDLNQYLAAGGKMGYINKFTLYGYGNPVKWTNNPDCSPMAF